MSHKCNLTYIDSNKYSNVQFQLCVRKFILQKLIFIHLCLGVITFFIEFTSGIYIYNFYLKKFLFLDKKTLNLYCFIGCIWLLLFSYIVTRLKSFFPNITQVCITHQFVITKCKFYATVFLCQNRVLLCFFCAESYVFLFMFLTALIFVHYNSDK